MTTASSWTFTPHVGGRCQMLIRCDRPMASCRYTYCAHVAAWIATRVEDGEVKSNTAVCGRCKQQWEADE